MATEAGACLAEEVEEAAAAAAAAALVQGEDGGGGWQRVVVLWGTVMLLCAVVAMREDAVVQRLADEVTRGWVQVVLARTGVLAVLEKVLGRTGPGWMRAAVCDVRRQVDKVRKAGGARKGARTGADAGSASGGCTPTEVMLKIAQVTEAAVGVEEEMNAAGAEDRGGVGGGLGGRWGGSLSSGSGSGSTDGFRRVVQSVLTFVQEVVDFFVLSIAPSRGTHDGWPDDEAAATSLRLAEAAVADAMARQDDAGPSPLSLGSLLGMGGFGAGQRRQLRRRWNAAAQLRDWRRYRALVRPALGGYGGDMVRTVRPMHAMGRERVGDFSDRTLSGEETSSPASPRAARDIDDNDVHYTARLFAGAALEQPQGPPVVVSAAAVYDLEPRKKQLLMLDLDETLIYAASITPEVELVHSSTGVGAATATAEHGRQNLMMQHDFAVYDEETRDWIRVWKRPFVDVFLEEMSRWYDVGVFTASYPCYADPIIDTVDTERVIQRRLYNDSVTYHATGYEKDLSKACFKRFPHGVVMVDNSPRVCVRHVDNLIVVPDFRGNDAQDQALLDLIPFLISLTATDDVRSIIKMRNVPRFASSQSVHHRVGNTPVRRFRHVQPQPSSSLSQEEDGDDIFS